jgi:FkbM family methyltransferase
MVPKIANIGKYKVTYFNKVEFQILKKEIFQQEIYSISLEKNNSKTLKILDVGAHIGLATLYFKKIYPNSHITCFEPNPNIFPLLEENIFCNNLKNVKAFNIAIGKDSSERKLYIDSSGYGAFSTASFRKDAWNRKQKSTPIEVKTELLSKYIKSRVDLFKLDVEGAELEILKELDSKNSFDNIQNMLIEYHPQEGQNINNLLEILKRNSFKLEYKKEGQTLNKPVEDLILVVAKK